MINFKAVADARELRVASQTVRERIVLIGDVVTMNSSMSIMRAGRICIDGNQVVAITPSNGTLPSGFEQATQVDTQGTIFPGLIDLHNHLSYDMIPMWNVPRRFANRNQWRTADDGYTADVAKPASILTKSPDIDYHRAIVRFAECRNVLGGVTTGQGMSMSTPDGEKRFYDGLMRVVERPLEAGWPTAAGQTLDFTAAEIVTKLVPALQQRAPFFYHLSEGTDADARQRFLDLRLSDGSWAINQFLICIHCVALEGQDFDQLKAASGIVWSPTSNFLLYGSTARIEEAKKRGIPVALGADWSPSGCKNVLGEIKIARIVNEQMGSLFSARELVSMVTCVPAKMLGWEGYVGSIEAGRRADVLVIRGQADDPYSLLIDAEANSIVAVLIDGRVRLCTAELGVGSASTCEPLLVGGHSYLLDLAADENEPMAGMSLSTALAKLTYGLEHLPELGAKIAAATKTSFYETSQRVWTLDLEFESEPNRMNVALDATFDPPVHPMQLEPITAVDDVDFVARLKSNRNMPTYIKDQL